MSSSLAVCAGAADVREWLAVFRRFRGGAHESPARKLVASAEGDPYEAIESLGDARGLDDAVLVLDGDWGGQIYVTCPVREVRCDQAALEQLLRDLDRFAWDSNDGDGAGLRFERRMIGSPVPGGMGGAVVEDGIWVHDDFEALGVGESIRQVVRAERERMAELPSPNRPRFDGRYVSAERWPDALRFAADGHLEVPGGPTGTWEIKEGMLHMRIGERAIIGAVFSGTLVLPADEAFDTRPMECDFAEYLFQQGE